MSHDQFGKGIRLQALTIAAGLAAFLGSAMPSLGIGIEDVVDGGNTYAWQQVELPGTVCGNGSQYRFYVYDSPSSNNLLILFEGGGACWDYDTCSGRAGILGAAHPNGIPDNYIHGVPAEVRLAARERRRPRHPAAAEEGHRDQGLRHGVHAVLHGRRARRQQRRDVHGPDRARSRRSPGATSATTTRARRSNYLHTRFPTINKLLVTGFSAGGVATSAGYYQARRTLLPTKGYLLNDSGPIFPAPNATYKSRPLHELIRAQWNLASLYAQLPATFNQNDFGRSTTWSRREFPNDQLAYTGYSSDYNFSRFSYERFYPGITQAGVLPTGGRTRRT